MIGIDQIVLHSRRLPLCNDSSQKHAAWPDEKSNVDYAAVLRRHSPPLKDQTECSNTRHSTKFSLLSTMQGHLNILCAKIG
jgi:hypothetical protein